MKKLTSEKQFYAYLEEIKKHSEKFYEILHEFFQNYKKAISTHSDFEQLLPLFYEFISCVVKQVKSPYPFELFHQKVRKPYDYYDLGMQITLPLVDLDRSKLYGHEHLRKITQQLKNKENVIFFANHQTEVDPYLIDILLKDDFKKLGQDMIFVAGERVITDPTAIPFSMGRDLLCIYSKKYVDNPPEKKREKQAHNTKTMKKMSELLSKGGHAIYVAPSGGRDRRDEKGKITPAPFDPGSIEMFHLMAKKAATPTHFYPMTLHTYDLLPPPKETQKELGEQRDINYSPIFISVGKEIDMENFPGKELKDKKKKREAKANAIYSQILKDYETIT